MWLPPHHWQDECPRRRTNPGGRADAASPRDPLCLQPPEHAHWSFLWSQMQSLRPAARATGQRRQGQSHPHPLQVAFPRRTTASRGPHRTRATTPLHGADAGALPVLPLVVAIAIAIATAVVVVVAAARALVAKQQEPRSGSAGGRTALRAKRQLQDEG